MHREFNDNWNKILQAVSQTANDVAELNVDLLNRITRVSSVTPSDLTQPKKPEDMFRLLNNTNLEVIKYTQDLSEIYLENAQRLGKIMGEIMRETTANASRVATKATKVAKDAVKEE